jgi:serpin B
MGRQENPLSLCAKEKAVMRPLLAGLLVLAAVVATVPSRAEEKPVNKQDQSALVRGNNQAALALYAQLRGREGNLIFSPYSISTALGMTFAGARGETAEQIAKALHFDLPPDKLNAAFGSLIKEINGAGKERSYQLSTANALWAQKGYSFLPAFLQITKEDYGAGLKEVDFKETEQARKTINAWVEKETRDRIKDLLKPGVLQPDTRLVLTNAIYFKGDWTSQFKKEATHDGPFFLAGGKEIKVPLMHQTHRFSYFEGDTFQALQMPYVGNHLAMVVLLPKKKDGLADLEKALTADKLKEWTDKLRTEEIIVTLPKFKATTDLSLKKTLSDMGMPIAFTARADFSGITRSESLLISDAIHQAFVEVNEKGTEAAAATAITFAPTSAPVNPKPPVVFRADHPFVYVLRDVRTGSILFMGRLVDPR